MRVMLPAKLRALGIAACAVLLGTVALAPSANAGTKPGQPGTALRGHCVIQLARGLNHIATPTCFTTFTAAVKYATGGVVTNAPAQPTRETAATTASKINSANAAATQRQGLRVAAAAAPVVVGIEYADADYAGWTLTMAGPAACTGPTSDIDYSLDLPLPLWDMISSFQNFNVCYTDHFYYAGFSGPHTGFFASQSTMPPMISGNVSYNGNDNTRSLEWS